MRLDFNVLWVDDQPNAVRAQITRIKQQMEEEGFNFNPTLCKSFEEVESLITGDVFQDEVDLILVDWDLGSGVQGQDVIQRIRQVAQYKDVVFYSALTTAPELRRYAFDKQLEGIFCASRQDLVVEVLGVFESMVKKVLDLDHTRGIVMGATSDIDEIVRTCLVDLELNMTDVGKKELLAQGVKRVRERVKEITKMGDKLANSENIEEILNAHMIFGANDKLRMLVRLLKKNETTEATAEKVRLYMEEIVPERNTLGHMVLAPEGKPQAVANNEGKQINLEDMRILRKAILISREDFRALAETLRK